MNISVQKISFTTKTGHSIVVQNGSIWFDDKMIYSAGLDNVIYNSQLNQIIEENGNTLLFLAVDESPNLDHVNGFQISNDTALFVADCVYNSDKRWMPFTDVDNDGFLEFGGFKLTEAHPSADSMYYNPSLFYEIRNGEVVIDSVLMEKLDTEVNGVYLQNDFDSNGNCCIAIPKPKQ